MIKLLGNIFEKMLAFFAFCILAVGGHFGYIEASTVALMLSIKVTHPILVGAIGAVIGVAVAFIVDVFVYGFVAKILAAIKDIEAIREHLDKQ